MAVDPAGRPDASAKPSRFLTPAQVAEELSVSVATVYRLLPQIGVVHVGRAIRVERAALERWIASMREAPRGTPQSVPYPPPEYTIPRAVPRLVRRNPEDIPSTSPGAWREKLLVPLRPRRTKKPMA